MEKKILTALMIIALSVPLAAFGSREKTTGSDAAPPAGGGNPAPAAPAAPAKAPTPDESGAVPAEIAAALTKAGIQTVKERVPVVDFTLPKLGGGTASLGSLKGQVVFLNFWATWCPPCREEMPSMEKLYVRFKDRGFTILAVDLQEDEKTVAEFVKKYKLTFPVALDGSGRIGGTYGVRGIPTTYIVDREGGIVGAVVGGKDWGSPEVVAAFETLIRHGK
jgi:peroxiredoxin